MFSYSPFLGALGLLGGLSDFAVRLENTGTTKTVSTNHDTIERFPLEYSAASRLVPELEYPKRLNPRNTQKTPALERV